MKVYRMYFSYTEYGVCSMKAKSEKEARKKLENHLKEKGLSDLKYEANDMNIYIQGEENDK